MDILQEWERKPLVFFDVETTGLSPSAGDAICEIGALKITPDNSREEFSCLINPGRPIPREVSLIHAIYDEDVKDAPFFRNVADEFVQFLSGTVVCGYNVRFDLGFLNAEFEKIHYPRCDHPALDVLSMARRLLPGLPRYKLSSVAETLEIEIQRLHRALDDARLTAEVFFTLRRRAQQNGPTKISECLSLYGIPNEFYMKIQEPKVEFLRESLADNINVKITYLNSQHQKETVIAKPRELSGDKEHCLKAVDASGGREMKIDISHIIAMEVY